MAKPSPMRQLYLARVQGLRRARAEEAERLGLPPPAEGDVEEEILALADRYGDRRSWVAPPRPRREGSTRSYLAAAVVGAGILGAVAVALGASRRR